MRRRRPSRRFTGWHVLALVALAWSSGVAAGAGAAGYAAVMAALAAGVLVDGLRVRRS